MLCNNYRSHNLIGHYHFWVISPRNTTLFTRQFLAGRRARVGHETRPSCWWKTCIKIHCSVLRQNKQPRKSKQILGGEHNPCSGTMTKNSRFTFKLISIVYSGMNLFTVQQTLCQVLTNIYGFNLCLQLPDRKPHEIVGEEHSPLGGGDRIPYSWAVNTYFQSKFIINANKNL